MIGLLTALLGAPEKVETAEAAANRVRLEVYKCIQAYANYVRGDKCFNLLPLPPMPKRSKLETYTLAIRRIARQNHNVMAVTPRAAMSRQGADTKQRRYV